MGAREDEFRSFYAREYAAVAGYCWTLVRDRELAHDLAQEAFTRVLARWVAVDEPRAYVFHVATNLVRRAWRTRTHQRFVLQALTRERPVDAPPPDPVTVALRDAVEALPRRLRDVVLLHYYADLSVADVALSVGRPAGTVKRQLAEARALLAGVVAVAGG